MKSKEQAVFEAVGDLVLSGADLHSLTVSDIACKAGVGKGTVYEYVSSKEELIAKGMAYSLGCRLQEALRRAEATEGFRGKLNVVLDCIDRAATCEDFLFSAFRASQNVHAYAAADCEIGALVFPAVKRLLEHLTQAAEQEGLITSDADSSHVLYAFISAFAGYAFLRSGARKKVAAMGAENPASVRGTVLDAVTGMIWGTGGGHTERTAGAP